MNWIEWLPHINAGLNLIATVLLLWGLITIKRRGAAGVDLHRKIMLTCFAVSCVFLAGYLTNRGLAGDKKFPADRYPTVAWFYWSFLAVHVALAACVPFLALRTIYLGLRQRVADHKWWARITFPIWLYVSVSGVLVYLMLRWIYV